MIHIALHSPQTKGRKYPIAGQGPAIMANGIGGAYDSHMSIEDDGKPEPMTVQTDKPPYRVPSMAEIAAIPWNGYNVASLFSGCGGSSLGYKMAGFKVVYANEFVPAAQDTYRANHPDTHLDIRDVRTVTPESILSIIGMERGQLDVLDGSPPCASFSTAGKREASWGKVKEYSDVKQRTDDLFWEYIRILKGVQPKVFIAENVSGLVKGTAKGYFLEILRDMKACGYRVTCRILDAQWLGVPQKRSRTIFIGVRNDIGLEPCYPKPLPYRYSVRDALPWIETIGSSNGFGESHQVPASQPYHTVGTGPQQGNGLARFVEARIPEPESDISNYAIGREWDTLRQGEQSSKYFNLVKPSLEEPCPTVTTRGGNNHAASVVHPLERRKFTIAELRRICSFPDDFILTGSYSQQWERLGRAVPPVMMAAVAKAVREGVLNVQR